ncbi:unnamed protein product [Caenorhabditis bovis]|uniref:Uncharacterized protein n=1 Tax=Caenorhabditis bovis TaxID=2654633 RepID=A0A8S1F0N8_9PELO|nr:unnamed protein product [Caenorhabditis bovis]
MQIVREIPVRVQQNADAMPSFFDSTAPNNTVTPVDSPTRRTIRVETNDDDDNHQNRFVDCPFKIHGCHKRGATADVKRHVRDDRWVSRHNVLASRSIVEK